MGGPPYRGDDRPTSNNDGFGDVYRAYQARHVPDPPAKKQPAERTTKPIVSPLKVAVPGTQKFKANGLPIPGSMKFKDGVRAFECLYTNGEKHVPIVIAFDVTRSRGEDIKILFDKLPMLVGQLVSHGYVEHPSISFCGIGDATAGDKCPIQPSYFETDTRLDEVLANIWAEKGGGGTGQESYELAAYLYATRSKLESLEKDGEKGFFFFIGDEGFYPEVNKDQVKKVLGDEIAENLDSKSIFRLLQEKYHVFFIHPKLSWEERKKDIDAEIKERVTKKGGMIEGVDLRFSLRWNTFDDLDAHAEGPDGHISFKQRELGNGKLDVDENAGGPHTNKAIENIRWPKGKAPKGHYRFWVHFFATHDSNTSRKLPMPFYCELENNGEVTPFEGEIGRVNQNVVAFECDYDPDARPVYDENLVYANYDDKVIHDQWASVIPEDHILPIEDPKAVADIIIGVLALYSGTDPKAYDADLESREQSPARREEVATALRPLFGTLQEVVVEGDLDDLG